MPYKPTGRPVGRPRRQQPTTKPTTSPSAAPSTTAAQPRCSGVAAAARALRFARMLDEQRQYAEVIQLSAARALEVVRSPQYTDADKLDSVASFLSRIIIDADVLRRGLSR
jgi:hypothetical protein